ncbi:hypothetical protein [uncultured Pseudonocardia sp.]|uniref:hypothetical protein n=1 Tax=uncultured Pseudonocardia sp. TaxID=211455 RepID=UPI002612D60B|nr:hypothetical protein [uncultured Pseudonocardia sp.]
MTDLDNTASTTPHAGPVILAASGTVTWTHRRGTAATALLRIRTLRTGPRTPVHPGTATIAVASALRGNPRGHGLTADFTGLAHAALTQVIPAAVPPATITWYAHHGPFSTFDESGPETLTHIQLHWDGQRYRDPGPADQHLLSPEQVVEIMEMLQLEPAATLSPSSTDSTGPAGPSAGK